MNHFDAPEYSGLGSGRSAGAATTPPAGESAAPSSLSRLVAVIHRHAAAPRGFRFCTNIDLADRDRALVAMRYGASTGEMILQTASVDDAGCRVDALALYVRYDRPEPLAFWTLFHSLGHADQA